MAEDQRRMLFDVRGRRKNVIRVVYAALAVLMAASLFLVVGPGSIGGLIGNSGPGETTKILIEQAERAEARAVRERGKPGPLLAVARARVAAGNSLADTNPQTGTPVLTPEARENYAQAAEAWNLYLGQTDNPSPSGAGLMAGAFFTLAESLGEVKAIDRAIADAARAQRIAAKAQPSIGTLTTLAIYEFFDGDFAAGNKAGKEAQALAVAPQAKEIKQQIAEYRQNGKAWQSQKKRAAKAEKERGKESLENPFGGLGGSSGIGN